MLLIGYVLVTGAISLLLGTYSIILLGFKRGDYGARTSVRVVAILLWGILLVIGHLLGI